MFSGYMRVWHLTQRLLCLTKPKIFTVKHFPEGAYWPVHWSYGDGRHRNLDVCLSNQERRQPPPIHVENVRPSPSGSPFHWITSRQTMPIWRLGSASREQRFRKWTFRALRWCLHLCSPFHQGKKMLQVFCCKRGFGFRQHAEGSLLWAGCPSQCRKACYCVEMQCSIWSQSSK